MTSTITYAGPPAAPFGSIGHGPVSLKPSEVAAARRMVAKYVPESDEVELRRMLGIHHD